MRYFAGWGTLLEQCFDEICHFTGGRPDFICDNSVEKHGRSLHGIPCIPFAAVQEGSSAEFFITIRDHHSVAQQLLRQGYSRIRCIHFERSYYKLKGISAWDSHPKIQQLFPQDFFRGRRIFITGASRGLGAALAEQLAAMGGKLTLHARKLEHLEQTRHACEAYGQKVDAVQADLESLPATQLLADRLRQIPDGVDIVYHNAAVSPGTTAGDLERSFKVNAIAPILLTEALLPGMRERKFGRVVHVTTELQHSPMNAAYACSKAALDKYAADLAPSLAGSGLAASLVNPGSLRTDMNPQGKSPIGSALNGLLVAATLEKCNGRWLTAQDYCRLSLDEAYTEAIYRLGSITP